MGEVNWEIISQIPEVRIRAIDANEFIWYNKDPYMYDTNVGLLGSLVLGPSDKHRLSASRLVVVCVRLPCSRRNGGAGGHLPGWATAPYRFDHHDDPVQGGGRVGEPLVAFGVPVGDGAINGVG
ncbi:Disease resistance protein [Musa troglodytarum]|uniref:Disease resistance protein n=1 Tax=Musa troglodytarum TaxID=320322 RepID=A0A9E7HIZ0_9LILI|nr:Disease resistance protein [Musa troglodytarum]